MRLKRMLDIGVHNTLWGLGPPNKEKEIFVNLVGCVIQW